MPWWAEPLWLTCHRWANTISLSVTCYILIAVGADLLKPWHSPQLESWGRLQHGCRRPNGIQYCPLEGTVCSKTQEVLRGRAPGRLLSSDSWCIQPRPLSVGMTTGHLCRWRLVCVRDLVLVRDMSAFSLAHRVCLSVLRLLFTHHRSCGHGCSGKLISSFISVQD